MSHNKNRNIETIDHQQWLQLIERYFDADTTDNEEQCLKQFLASPHSNLPQYDEIKAVMGYLSTGKRYNIQAKKPRTININKVLKWSVAAAVAIGIFGTATIQLNNDNDICIAYINGKKYTDEAIVLAQMQSTMQQINKGIEEHSLEHQLGNMFRTMSNYDNENQ